MPEFVTASGAAAADRLHAVCPICGLDRPSAPSVLRDHLSPEQFTLATCGNCGGRYLLDPPTPDAIGAYYDTTAGAAMHRPPGRVFQALRDRRFALDLRPLLDRLTPSDLVADLGTGDGSLVDYLHRRGRPVVGLDVYPRGEWTHGDVPYAQIDFAGNPVDAATQASGRRPVAVVMRHVLEHVHDPVNLLGRLREGGIEHVLIVVPNVESRLARPFGTDWYYWDPPRHLTFFAADSLRAGANRAGFDVPILRTYGLDEFATSAHRRLLIRRGPDSRAAHALRPTGPIAGAASILQAPLGDTVLHAVLDAR